MKKIVQTANYETVSNHDLIVTTVKKKGNMINKEANFRRSFKDFNQDYFKLNLLAQQWTRIYDLEDPNVITGIINEFFTQVLEIYIHQEHLKY